MAVDKCSVQIDNNSTCGCQNNQMIEPESRSSAIREFVLRNVSQYPRTIAKALADAFGISRQAANKHLAAPRRLKITYP